MLKQIQNQHLKNQFYKNNQMYQNQICLKVGQSLTALFRNQMKDCKLQKLNLQKIITHLLQVTKE